MTLPPPTHWTHRGLGLAYRAWGPEDGPAVLLLHGFLDTGAALGPVAEKLAGPYRVVVPDHRGHGESDHIASGGYYHFPDYVLDLDGLLTHLGLERVAIAGHSMGASIASYFGGAFPDRLWALALLDGIGPPGDTEPGEAPILVNRWIGDVRRRDSHEPRGHESLEAAARAIGRLAPTATEERLIALADAATKPGADGRRYWRFDPVHRTRAPTGFDAARFRAFLKRIQCPTLAVWAEKSLMHASDENERLEALGDVEQQTLAGVGHNMHHEKPEALATLLRTFLDRCLP
ncbi:MAG: alpha/beta hydrolase [Myxococcota bacterium]|nr:alpha/beta hydrolase [Myxococcota bacterium]